jgi:hypothetical protein
MNLTRDDYRETVKFLQVFKQTVNKSKDDEFW